jgi:hypothetical protein
MPIILDDQLEAALRFGHSRSGAGDGARQIADAIRGGTFEILRGDNQCLARFHIGGDMVSPDGELKLNFIEAGVIASAGGRAERAQFRDSSGEIRITGLTVGMRGDFELLFDNTHIPKGALIEAPSEAVLCFPAPEFCEGPAISLDVRLLMETEHLLALAMDFNGGRLRDTTGLPRIQIEGGGRTHVPVCVDELMLVRRGCVAHYDCEPNKTLLPLFCDTQTLPTFEFFIEAVRAVSPDTDWNAQQTLVLIARKLARSGHIFHGLNFEDFSDLDDLLISARDARADDDEVVAAPPTQTARPVALPPEDDDDRALREFFTAALASRDD